MTKLELVARVAPPHSFLATTCRSTFQSFSGLCQWET